MKGWFHPFICPSPPFTLHWDHGGLHRLSHDVKVSISTVSQRQVGIENENAIVPKTYKVKTDEGQMKGIGNPSPSETPCLSAFREKRWRVKGIFEYGMSNRYDATISDKIKRHSIKKDKKHSFYFVLILNCIIFAVEKCPCQYFSPKRTTWDMCAYQKTKE